MARIDLRPLTLRAMLASPSMATVSLATYASGSWHLMHRQCLTFDESNQRLTAVQLPLLFTQHLDM